MSAYMRTEAQNLKDDDVFKAKSYRNFRKAIKVIPIDDSFTNDEHKGKILIVLSDCKQMILDATHTVIVEVKTCTYCWRQLSISKFAKDSTTCNEC